MSLTTEQIEELKQQLRLERLRILSNIEALSAEFGISLTEQTDEHGLETHIADQGTMMFLRQHNLSLEEHEEQLLEEIDAALKRIKDGTYGVCEVDGTPIEYDRLVALPWARTHVAHTTT